MAHPVKTIFDVYRKLDQVPDVRKRGPRIRGSKTGLGYIEFLHQLFRLNEKERKTDPTLKRIIEIEFGHEPRTMESWQSGNTTVAKLRHEYNSGKLQPKSYPPEHPGKVHELSCRYDSKGRVVNPRFFSRVATNHELYNLHYRFGATVAETVEELMARLGRPATNNGYVPTEEIPVTKVDHG